MPADLVGGVITFLTQQLSPLNVWDGEIQRQDPAGISIAPPTDFPAIKAWTTEEGLIREWTTEDPYGDEGALFIAVWDTTRASVMAILSSIELLLAQSQNWPNINLGTSQPFEVWKMMLERWSCYQLEGIRTQQSELLYQGDFQYAVGLHGAVPTR